MMISLLVSFAVLIVGYLIYGRLAERVFSPDDRQTPAVAINDGVDCVPMKTWKAFLVQLLNIAGTGPIFGALMGAVFGPVVFLWIVFGSILGGAVHDYMSGMISSRHSGASVAELSGTYLGKGARWVMRVFSVVLLVLCGTVFVTSPAGLLDKLTPDWMSSTVWAVIILAYYLLATLLPIDKLIGSLYPVFAVLLIVMAGAVIGGIVFSGGEYTIPELSIKNISPDGTPVWPYMFITVACGAISGFHATQSPMIAKCITTEKVGRKVFYGAMISESVIALVWAAAGVSFYGTTQLLSEALSKGASNVVYDISTGVLGTFGGILAVAGVVICPITSGDTAFRSARLIIAETFNLEQKKIKNRLLITIPLLIIGGLLTWFAVINDNGFQTVWRYFSWSNQTLAMVALWTATAYLLKQGKYRFGSLLTALPASFMTAVSLTYILTAKEGFGLDYNVSVIAGISASAAAFIVYILALRRKKQEVADK
ncbi:carbon starvation CstA family protein [Ruminococcus sp. NK3A76]|uniref:carbon starvation CstA family protein n=1 Tax=Ruminococcus sp. NK3A76 TaxID=877411 RepID=UPI000AE27C4E